MPEIRDDPDAPQPKHSWLNELPLEQHTFLKQEAEKYLRQYLTLYSKKQPIGFDLIFPDFNTSPPSFISLLNQGAYYRIEIRPKKDIENISINIIQDEAPDLLIAHKPFKSTEIKYQTLQPGMIYAFPSSNNLNHDGQTTLSKEEITPNSFLSLLTLGFTHVIPNGLDHILFIIGICLTASTIKQLFWQSLIFTITHAFSIALIISQLFPIYSYSISNYIEPLIALSIAFIAIEVFFKKKSQSQNSYIKYRYLLIAIFGLIHGCGFAGSLGSSLQSISSENWITPLIIANIGIELAQALLIIVTFSILLNLRKNIPEKAYSHINKAISLCIMLIGIVWFFQRLP